MEALLGAVVGGVLTAIGSLIVALTMDKRTREQQRRENQMAKASEVLSAMQALNRKLIDVAHFKPDEYKRSPNLWTPYLEAVTRWNSARYAAAQIAPASEIALLDEIDRELDRLLERATSRIWTSQEFRSERQNLGRLGARYLATARENAGESPIRLQSLWQWADEVDIAATRGSLDLSGRPDI